jgi:hypothetical protein
MASEPEGQGGPLKKIKKVCPSPDSRMSSFLIFADLLEDINCPGSDTEEETSEIIDAFSRAMETGPHTMNTHLSVCIEDMVRTNDAQQQAIM